VPRRCILLRGRVDRVPGVRVIRKGKLGCNGLQVQCRLLRSRRGRVLGVSGERVVSWGAGGEEERVCGELERTFGELGERGVHLRCGVRGSGRRALQPVRCRYVVLQRCEDSLSFVFLLSAGRGGAGGLQVRSGVLRTGRGRMQHLSIRSLVPGGAGGAEVRLRGELELDGRKLGLGGLHVQSRVCRGSGWTMRIVS
jgi:hypothetical protein